MAESKKEMDDLCAMLSECHLLGNPREWWMDFDATHHVCANKELFARFTPSQGEEKIYMEKSAIAKVEGTGKVWLQMTSGKVLTLNNVLISLTNENKVKSTLPESIMFLLLPACEVNGLDFLRSAKNLYFFDLSNNRIQGKIPNWAWSNWMLSVVGFNLSHNMSTSIDGIPASLVSIYLPSNSLQWSVPNISVSLEYYFILNNNLSGEIPSSVCNLTSLKFLDLARNNLMGAIQGCLGNMSDQLEVMDMQHNSLSGNLQTTFSFRSQLKSFNLYDNKVEGNIPRSLDNCNELEVLDLGSNRLNDTFPIWLVIHKQSTKSENKLRYEYES
ncbi:receptor-like protein 7 [Capsicum annuum]|uniref:receptor-like protein 7 n=1 Tax=Capsicum annuum TaxID=4072 RepID=UPI001FB18B98|nr:receptor-like protein 7 [Capsicum annuum]